jgi:NADH:ubiquinone oxidoreductase subunit E
MRGVSISVRHRLFENGEVPVHRDEVDRIIARYARRPFRVIAMMQDIQAVLGYLPEGALRYLAGEIGVPLNRVSGIATFYKAFRLMPPGRHGIKLCTGTACHVRGAESVRDAIERDLGIHEGETTDDLRFSFETVHCVGCCGLAPVMVIDDDIHGKVGYSLGKTLEKYR